MQNLSRSRATQAISNSTKTLCPFLYQTRTISVQRDLPSARLTPTQNRQSEDNTLTFLQRKARDVEARRALNSTLTSSERETFMNIMKNFGAKIDGIAIPPQPPPSELVQPTELESVKHEPMQDPDSPLEPASVRATNRNIDDILSSFAPVKTTQRFSTFSSEAHESNSTSTPQDVRHGAMQSLQQISSKLKTALSSTTTPPDLALWRVLEADVFPLITLLQIHRSPSNMNPYQQTLASLPHDTLPTSISSLPPETPLLPLITILYPAATLLALHTYIAHLPASGFALTLLPKIRSLGPASYLLAGNTHFFNALLYLQWTVYSDLRIVLRLLSEMKRSGVEYDQGTIAQIEEIQWQRDEDMKEDAVSDRGRDWWAIRKQEDGWRRLMRRYRWDVLKEGREEKRNDEDHEEELIDHEIR